MSTGLLNFAPLILVAVVAVVLLATKARANFPKTRILWFAYGFLASQLLAQLINSIRSS